MAKLIVFWLSAGCWQVGDFKGNTVSALFMAVFHGHLECVEQLLAGGADGSSSCAWKEGAPSGASFDLSPLLDQSFKVTGGDISCTTVLEQEYSYAFNLCGAVDASVLGVAGAAASCAAMVAFAATETSRSCSTTTQMQNAERPMQ